MMLEGLPELSALGIAILDGGFRREMMDVFGLAQDLLAETRRLGNPAHYVAP